MFVSVRCMQPQKPAQKSVWMCNIQYNVYIYIYIYIMHIQAHSINIHICIYSLYTYMYYKLHTYAMQNGIRNTLLPGSNSPTYMYTCMYGYSKVIKDVRMQQATF